MEGAYYKRFPRKFLDACIGTEWTLEHKGAYALVIDLIFMRDGHLPDDSKYIAGQLGCSVRKWNSIKKFLIEQGKISDENGIISNKTANNLIIERRTNRDKNAENGRKRHKNKDNPQRTLEPNDQPRVEEYKSSTVVSSSSEESTTGVSAPSDSEFIWSVGLEFLVNAGSSTKAARPMLGRWIKDAGGGDVGARIVADAIRQAQTAGTGDPIPYISKIIKAKPKQAVSPAMDAGAPTMKLVERNGEFVLEAA